MKDTVITSKQKKHELYLLLACLLAAYILNIIGIIKFSSSAKELITQIPITLLIGTGFYVFIAFLRVLYYMISLIWKRK